MKKVFLAAFVIFAFVCLSARLPPAFADDNYDYNYSLSTPHVIINQVFGGKEAKYFSHSFIELYNPTDEEVDLSDYAVHYRSSSEDTKYGDKWYSFGLSGKIPSKSSYLIRCNELSKPKDTTYKIVSFDKDLGGGYSNFITKDYQWF